MRHKGGGLLLTGLIFDEKEHKYYDNGAELPSVTDIIRFCHYDRTRNSRRGNDPFYRERGSKVHALCLEYDMDGADSLLVPPGYAGYVNAYAAFLRDYGIKDWLYMEMPMGCLRLGFAGTPDRVGYIDRALAIVDFKTGAIDHVALSAQLTGYEWLVYYKTQTDRPIIRLGVHLQKDGKYRAVEVKRDDELFNACRILHSRYRRKGKGE